jgi:hypothetical protein
MARSQKQSAVQTFEIGQFVRSESQGLGTVIGYDDRGDLDVMTYVYGWHVSMSPEQADPSRVYDEDRAALATFRAFCAAADAEERADV